MTFLDLPDGDLAQRGDPPGVARRKKIPKNVSIGVRGAPTSALSHCGEILARKWTATDIGRSNGFSEQIDPRPVRFLSTRDGTLCTSNGTGVRGDASGLDSSRPASGPPNFRLPARLRFRFGPARLAAEDRRTPARPLGPKLHRARPQDFGSDRLQKLGATPRGHPIARACLIGSNRRELIETAASFFRHSPLP